MHDVIYDVVGVGIGPFNLSLAALADGVPGLRALFLDGKPEFSWHPGMMLDDSRMQVPFLADLVSLVDPTSRWSFLAYLRERERLFPFYFAEQWHPTRREYQDYCRWAASGLPSCRFGQRVAALGHDAPTGLFTVRTEAGQRFLARNVVLGVGTEPVVPPAFAALASAAVWHSEEYLSVVDKLCRETDVTVVGSGQSGAEVLLDLLRRRGEEREPRLRWVTRTPALAPMEYSKLGLEHFTPDYTRYFHSLPEAERDRLVPRQWQLYKAASAETLGELHEALYQRAVGGAPADLEIRPDTEVVRAAPGVELTLRHTTTGTEEQVHTGAVVLATGYAARRPAFLEPLADLIDWDGHGRYRVALDHRVATATAGGLYVQNAELHTHGVGTPDLGLGAHRAAVILNSLAGREVHRLPGRTAWTTFGPVHPSQGQVRPRLVGGAL